MREVQRLADRIVVHWVKLDEVALSLFIARLIAQGQIRADTQQLPPYTQWTCIPLHEDRNQFVLDYARVDAVPTDINPNDLTSLDKYRPAGPGWHWKGAEGWPGKGLVMTFDTESKNLELGDVSIEDDAIHWKDEQGNEFHEPATKREIIRDSRTGKVTEVRKR